MEIAKLAISGWFSRALAVAARLRIADVLGDGALTHTEVAARTETDPDVMLRLLQMLTVPGVVQRDEEDRFRLGESFAELRADHPLSQRHFAILAAELYDDAFGELEYTVRTGKSGFRKLFGEPLYDYLEHHPETADLFDKGMVDLARPVGMELARQHDFTGAGTVVDVGGGSGGLLPGILLSNPEARGVVADRASVCERGKAELGSTIPPAVPGAAEIATRISFQPCDFFAEVPAGGDRYLLKNVLHDWTFDNCVRILRTVADAMRRTAEDRPAGAAPPRLLVLEPLIEQDIDGWRAMFQMIACDEGMLGLDEQRMREALDAAGFEVAGVDRIATGHKVLDCLLRTGQ
ncbi:methyltransferase [Amycolatopsis cihanbeyliensis]|uniref:O-methyltransferase n=1 Tax=Amycolatopsis cihanbeyliensis TaxID=1128664 RepID=A0A542DJU3_AMYCI|nr:methyltransferase [Amycolatopsis cihanbeyliensis]TQJ03205.1 O-methyltransferase [Amycolatopsis cihanbeyliensis]WCB87234.1 EfrMII [Amycolatopsis cihanbeyliensis]